MPFFVKQIRHLRYFVVFRLKRSARTLTIKTVIIKNRSSMLVHRMTSYHRHPECYLEEFPSPCKLFMSRYIHTNYTHNIQHDFFFIIYLLFTANTTYTYIMYYMYILILWITIMS